MKKYTSAMAMMLLLASSTCMVSCFHNFYGVTTFSSGEPLMEQIQDTNRYFIVHKGSDARHLNNIFLNKEKTEISGSLEALPVTHQNYLTTTPDKTNRYKPAKEDPTAEVHLYISEYIEGDNGQIILPLSAIQKMEIYNPDKKATNSAFAGSMIGLGLVAASCALVIAGGLALGYE